MSLENQSLILNQFKVYNIIYKCMYIDSDQGTKYRNLKIFS